MAQRLKIVGDFSGLRARSNPSAKFSDSSGSIDDDEPGSLRSRKAVKRDLTGKNIRSGSWKVSRQLLRTEGLPHRAQQPLEAYLIRP